MQEYLSYPFNVGGIQLAIGCQEMDLLNVDLPINRFLQFGQPEVMLSVSYQDWPRVDLGSPVFNGGTNWSQYQHGDQQIIRLWLDESEPYGFGLFSEDFTRGRLYFRQVEPGGFIGDPISRPMGDVFFVNLLGKRRGAILHACGVIYNQSGVVFAGQGGVGKSTTARLWSDRADSNVVGDDRVIVRHQNGQFWIYGTPWPGTEGICNQGKAPLKVLYYLRHAAGNQVTRLTPFDVVSRLMVASFLARWDAAAITYSMELFEKLAEEIPCYELSFIPNQSAVNFVRNHLMTL